MKIKHLLLCLLPLCGLVSCNKNKTGDVEFIFTSTAAKKVNTLSFTLTPGLEIITGEDFHIDIDWGDGKIDTLTTKDFEGPVATNQHLYTEVKKYKVTINGPISGISFSDNIGGKLLSDDNVNIDKFVLNSIERIPGEDNFTVKLGGKDSAGEQISKLSEATINFPLTYLYEDMFTNTSLKTVNLPNSLIAIRGNDFAGLKTLKTINIPSDNHITIIEDGAFEGCSALESFTVPSYVTELGDDLFNGCESLKSFTFPSNVISLGSNTFKGCIYIKTLKFEEALPPTIFENTFETGYVPEKVIVPKGKKDTYKTEWKELLSEAFLEKIVEE